MRTKASDEDMGDPMAAITVREEVEVSWDHRNCI